MAVSMGVLYMLHSWHVWEVDSLIWATFKQGFDEHRPLHDEIHHFVTLVQSPAVVSAYLIILCYDLLHHIHDNNILYCVYYTFSIFFINIFLSLLLLLLFFKRPLSDLFFFFYNFKTGGKDKMSKSYLIIDRVRFVIQHTRKVYNFK